MLSFRQLYRSGQLSQYLLLLACVAGATGLLAARALVALSPIVGVLAVFANPHLRRDLPNYSRNGAAMRAAAMYALFILSGFYTADWHEWRHESFRLLPWIGVPLVFTLAVPLHKRQRLGVGVFYVLGAGLVALGTLGQYLRHPEAANFSFGMGQSMPSITRIFHIHFGVMLGLAFFSGLQLCRHRLLRPWLRALLALSLVVIVVTLHLLAYRTGLLVLYVTLVVNALRLVLQRRVAVGVALLALLAATPWVAYRTLPPVQQRWNATRLDIEQFQLGRDINEASLARRLAAWESASWLVRQHPLLGVGPADAHDAMMAQYDWHDYGLRPANRAMIHNQYLHYLVGCGVVGLALWLAVLLWPLTQPTQRRNPYIWEFVLVLGTAMLVDSLLELQIGFNLFVFFYGFLVVAGERHWREATALGNAAES